MQVSTTRNEAPRPQRSLAKTTKVRQSTAITSQSVLLQDHSGEESNPRALLAQAPGPVGGHMGGGPGWGCLGLVRFISGPGSLTSCVVVELLQVKPCSYSSSGFLLGLPRFDVESLLR